VTAARRRLLWQVRRFQAGLLDRASLIQRWQSWRGHASQADAAPLIAQIRGQLRAALAGGVTTAVAGN
jgi:hypothetical protein